MEEVWRAIDGFMKYEVSSIGRVRRVSGGQGAVAGKIIKWHTATSTGYPTVRMTNGGKARGMNVHKLVAVAFHGPRPEGLMVRHLDGDKMNAAAANLRYGTAVENARDKRRHGTWSGWYKLSPEDVSNLRARRIAGESVADIAASLAVSKSHVHRICIGVRRQEEASNRLIDRSTQ